MNTNKIIRSEIVYHFEYYLCIMFYFLDYTYYK